MQNPRCFKGIRKENLGVHYFNNPSAWMTGSIFAAWLKILNRRVRGKNAVLLVDNASSRRCIFEEIKAEDGLHHVRYSENLLVLFLPANMTSEIHPMDMGIMAKFKTLYRSRFVKWKLHQIEKGEGAVKLNILQAISMLIKAWEKVGSKCVAECYRRPGILTVCQRADVNNTVWTELKGVEKPFLDELAENLKDLGIETI